MLYSPPTGACKIISGPTIILTLCDARNLLTSRCYGSYEARRSLPGHRVSLAFAELVGAAHTRASRMYASGTWRLLDGHVFSRYSVSARQSFRTSPAREA